MNPLAKSKHLKWAFLILVTDLMFLSCPLRQAMQAQVTSERTQTTRTPTAEAQPAMERGNAQRTGVYRTGGPSPTGEASWQSQKIFEMKRGRIESVPSVLAADRSGDIAVPGLDIFWPYEGVGYSDPIVADGILYFSVSIGDGYLNALDARTGQSKWRVKRENGLYSPPTVAGEMLYVGADSGLFLAVDLKKNQEKWRHTRKDQSGVVRSPAMADGLIYYAATNGILYALDASTGALKWSYETKAPNLSAPAAGDGMIYFSSQGYLYGLDSQSGKENWKLQLKEGGRTPAVANGLVYFVDYEGHIRSVDAKTGQPQPKPQRDDQTAARIVIKNQVIYFTGRNTGKLFAIDAITREKKWEFSIAYDVRCVAPIADAELVYTTCSDGRLYAVEATTGKRAWTGQPRKFPLSSPVVADGMVYFISDDGKVYGVK